MSRDRGREQHRPRRYGRDFWAAGAAADRLVPGVHARLHRQRGLGRPAESTMFYTLYLYQEGFVNYRMGYASALAWVLLVLIAVVTGVNFLVSKKWVHYES
ncbi:MAG: hypothetical protein ACRDQ0_17830 [Pseudonocardia sp.]